MPLPALFDTAAADRASTPLSTQCKSKYECGLDDTCAVNVPQPKTKQEEDALVARFLTGLDKLFTKQRRGEGGAPGC